jgi:hypothetical protein
MSKRTTTRLIFPNSYFSPCACRQGRLPIRRAPATHEKHRLRHHRLGHAALAGEPRSWTLSYSTCLPAPWTPLPCERVVEGCQEERGGGSREEMWIGFLCPARDLFSPPCNPFFNAPPRGPIGRDETSQNVQPSRATRYRGELSDRAKGYALACTQYLPQ